MGVMSQDMGIQPSLSRRSVWSEHSDSVIILRRWARGPSMLWNEVYIVGISMWSRGFGCGEDGGCDCAARDEVVKGFACRERRVWKASRENVCRLPIIRYPFFLPQS